MTPGESRRAALRGLGWLVAAAAGRVVLGYGKEKEELACAKPSALGEAEQHQRKLDNYTEKSPDPVKTCSVCRFFTPGAKGTVCGKCEIFNGPANPQGRCDDWTPRAA
jgi:hypothetical protein